MDMRVHADIAAIHMQIKTICELLDELAKRVIKLEQPLQEEFKEPEWWENIPEHGILVKANSDKGSVRKISEPPTYPEEWIPLTNEEIEAFKR